MSTYFVDPYTKYYNGLNSNTSIVNESKNVVSFISDSVTTLNTLNSQLKSSSWREKGYSELLISAVPGLASNVTTLENFASDGLFAACSMAIKNLLPLVTELKAEDEKYEDLKKQLASLTPVSEYDEKGKPNSGYADYIKTKTELENAIEESMQKCIKLQNDAKNSAQSIKAMDGSVAFATSSNAASSSSSIYSAGLATDNLVAVNYNGEEFYVVNTKVPVIDYAEHVQKNKMYQNAGVLGSQCMIASQVYARDLLIGHYTSYDEFANALNGNAATKINNKCLSSDKNEVISFVYNEINEGHPVVLQVTQKRSNEGLRHLVTVVGYNQNVKSASELTEKDILVLDNVDGKIQTLSERNRTLYDQGKGYYALAPTEAFLAKEVDTVSNTAYA